MKNPKLDFKVCFLIILFIQVIGCSSITFLNHKNVPSPGGIYPVGTRIFEWIDSSRTDIFVNKDDEFFRKIIVQIWYPGANVKNVNKKFSYFQNDEKTAAKLASHFSVPKFFVKSAVNLKTHALINIEPKIETTSYPLILFSHGRGGYRHQNSIQCEELASHGYIVVAVNHTYDSFLTIFEDGTSAPYLSQKSENEYDDLKSTLTTSEKLDMRVSDIEFVLEQLDSLVGNGSFFDIIDMTKVGMFGHSFGGATTIALSNKNSRIIAAIGLDTWFIPLADSILHQGMGTPFLHLGQHKWRGMPDNYRKMKTLMENSTAKFRHYAAYRMKHYDFTDGPQYTSSAKVLIPFFSWEDRSEMREMLNNMILVYFDSYLKNIDKRSIDDTAGRFSKILVN